MWLFAPSFFVSVVEDATDPSRTRLIVRARVKSDLDDGLRGRYMPELGPTVMTPERDYLCRASIRRDDFAAGLVNDLVAGQARNTLHKRLAAWAAPDLLLIYELGYLSFDARGADLLYQVFNKRYQRSATIVTTNLPFKDWGKLFSNSAAASAIADRLVHKGLLVRIAGKSRRSDAEVEPPQAA